MKAVASSIYPKIGKERTFLWWLRMNDIQKSTQNWERRDEELNRKIVVFEKEFKHMKPCKRYIETKYCVHLVNAQQKKFGKDANSLLADLVGISQDKQ